MKKSNIGFGIFLLSIGIVLLLINLNVINWSVIEILFEFWPAILIIIGINIIFRNNEIVRTVAWLFFLAAMVALIFFSNKNDIRPGRWNNGRSINGINIDREAETESADLIINLGGIRINIGSTDTMLISSDTLNSDVKHSIDYKNGKKSAIVKIDREPSIHFENGLRETCKLNLNDDVVWNFNIDTGAVNGTIDMSDLKVKSIDMDTGAANMKLIFGSKYNSTDVKIDAAASSFNIVVPENSGVKIKVDGVLNNTNLNNLNWLRQGEYYVSPNYDSAENKINIDIDMGAGSLNIDVK